MSSTLVASALLAALNGGKVTKSETPRSLPSYFFISRENLPRLRKELEADILEEAEAPSIRDLFISNGDTTDAAMYGLAVPLDLKLLFAYNGFRFELDAEGNMVAVGFETPKDEDNLAFLDLLGPHVITGSRLILLDGLYPGLWGVSWQQDEEGDWEAFALPVTPVLNEDLQGFLKYQSPVSYTQKTYQVESMYTSFETCDVLENHNAVFGSHVVLAESTEEDDE